MFWILNSLSGILSTLLSECSGKGADAAAIVAELISDETLWRVVGILLSFYFKIFPVVMPTKNNLFLCYLCTFEFVYSDHSWTSPGELRHRMGELFQQCQKQLKTLLFSEHEILSENADVINQVGVAFGLYKPPVQKKEIQEEERFEGFDEEDAPQLIRRTQDDDNFPSKKRCDNVSLFAISVLMLV